MFKTKNQNNKQSIFIILFFIFFITFWPVGGGGIYDKIVLISITVSLHRRASSILRIIKRVLRVKILYYICFYLVLEIPIRNQRRITVYPSILPIFEVVFRDCDSKTFENLLKLYVDYQFIYESDTDMNSGVNFCHSHVYHLLIW